MKLNDVALANSNIDNALRAAGKSETALKGNTVSGSAAAVDELMSQLIDDADRNGSQPASSVVLQALKAAGLSADARNIELVNLLIANNMSISKDAIRQTLAEAKAYPGTDIETLIQMNRAGIPVNAESTAVMNEFAERRQILFSDINELADMVETVLSDPSAPGTLSDTIKNAILDTVNSAVSSAQTSEAPDANAAGMPGNIPADRGAVSTGVLSATASGIQTVLTAPVVPEGQSYRIVIEATPASLPEESATEEGGEALRNAVGNPGSTSADSSASAGSGLQTAQTDIGAQTNIAAQAEGEGTETAVADPARTSSENADNTTSARPADESLTSAAAQPVSSAPESLAAADTAGRIVSDPYETHNDYSFRNFEELTRDAGISSEHPLTREDIDKMSPHELKLVLRSALSLKPKDLNRESIKDLYKRAVEFTAKLENATRDGGSRSGLHSKAGQTAKDLQLLEQLNRVYPHFELPLKLNSGDGEGGLYVYNNRRSGSTQPGHSTALLHLNMPNLGIVDVHLDLKDSYLGLHFYADAESNALLSGNISELRDKLESMDYSVITGFKLRSEEKADIPSVPDKNALSAPAGDTPARLSFDTRA